MLSSKMLLIYYRHAPGYKSTISPKIIKETFSYLYSNKTKMGYSKGSYEHMYKQLGKLKKK